MLSHLTSRETVLLVNEVGVVIAARGTWRPILGQEAAEMLGQRWWDYVHPQDLVTMQAVWYQVFEQPAVAVRCEGYLRALDGQWVGVELTLVNELADPGVRAVVIMVALRQQVAHYDGETTHVQGRQYDLALALTQEEFILHYQPVVDLGTGKPVGFEALVRWQHPSWGLLAPGEFIPLAEASGLVVPLGRWVLERALRQLGRWQAQWPQMTHLQMHVNVAPVQLTDPDFVPHVFAAVQAAGLQPQQLVLEITEGVLAGALAAVHDTLSRLREFGVLVALDDFGTVILPWGDSIIWRFNISKLTVPF
ncbi:diguanylate cyclase/phosphodiesterase with PAS/PAC sensor(s) [Gloeomargarita lithophora Alchichica-D10]|uniref:Diguanylate cyclase/phosphodiesterase with PAS/PAC sensor(S) n=1 Tax=Gloeomargarita lithophora Alchichica-D10 TaxID=1188229 RepID=A0A1J0ADD7_9CYAN|nr:diguanylate cyclase/phosphodiesterase with PAS/PAC sensor(s) [Gloeomargarita lithophora Alchichica-D10]